jgi:hypothetical protein
MTSSPIQYDSFDDAATLAMGEAFDRACFALRRFGSVVTAREMIAKRIIGAARNGERDPIRLCEQALIPVGIEDMSMLVVSIGRDPPVGAYASVARAARSIEPRPMQPIPQRIEAGFLLAAWVFWPPLLACSEFCSGLI